MRRDQEARARLDSRRRARHVEHGARSDEQRSIRILLRERADCGHRVGTVQGHFEGAHSTSDQSIGDRQDRAGLEPPADPDDARRLDLLGDRWA